MPPQDRGDDCAPVETITLLRDAIPQIYLISQTFQTLLDTTYLCGVTSLTKSWTDVIRNSSSSGSLLLASGLAFADVFCDEDFEAQVAQLTKVTVSWTEYAIVGFTSLLNNLASVDPPPDNDRKCLNKERKALEKHIRTRTDLICGAEKLIETYGGSFPEESAASKENLALASQTSQELAAAGGFSSRITECH